MLTSLTIAAVLGCRSPESPPGPPAPALPAVEQPDVVVVIGCTIRRDQLDPYGSGLGLTPFLAELAGRGALFEDALAAAPWTKPGHVALLTGQHAVSVGMVEPDRGRNSRRLSERATTMAELFSLQGYATLGLTANPNINAIFGTAQGFDAYFEGSELWREVGTVKTAGSVMVDRALELVSEVPRDRPIYLQLTLVDSHEPFDTTQEEAKALVSGDEPLLLGRYRGDLQHFDQALRRLHDGLEAAGRGQQRTIFVVVSDHGEGADWPENQEVQHGYSLYEPVVAMPWVVAGPGVARSHRVAGLASQVDVLPTIAGLAQVPGYIGPGQDWSAALRGETDRTTRTRAWSDSWFWEVQRAAVFTDERACMDEYLRLDRTRSPMELPVCWDRRRDPLAQDPLPPDEALLAELRRWRADRRAELQAWPDTADAELDRAAQLQEQLEGLGYVEPD